MGRRSYRGSGAPGLLLLLGSQTVWTESDWYVGLMRPIKHPPGCRCGCTRPAAKVHRAGWPVPPDPHVVVPPPARESRYQQGRMDCPDGCRDRSLEDERFLGLDRVCLRCLCHSDDPPHWEVPTAWRAARAEARKKEADRERLARSKARRRPGASKGK
jgi:hypothetical protein